MYFIIRLFLLLLHHILPAPVGKSIFIPAVFCNLFPIVFKKTPVCLICYSLFPPYVAVNYYSIRWSCNCETKFFFLQHRADSDSILSLTYGRNCTSQASILISYCEIDTQFSETYNVARTAVTIRNVICASFPNLLSNVFQAKPQNNLAILSFIVMDNVCPKPSTSAKHLEESTVTAFRLLTGHDYF